MKKVCRWLYCNGCNDFYNWFVLVVLLRNFLPEYSFCINILNLSYSLSYCIFIVRLDFEEILNGWKLFGFISTFLLFLKSWSKYFYLLFVTFIRDVYTFLIFFWKLSHLYLLGICGVEHVEKIMSRSNTQNAQFPYMSGFMIYVYSYPFGKPRITLHEENVNKLKYLIGKKNLILNKMSINTAHAQGGVLIFAGER